MLRSFIVSHEGGKDKAREETGRTWHDETSG